MTLTLPSTNPTSPFKPHILRSNHSPSWVPLLGSFLTPITTNLPVIRINVPWVNKLLVQLGTINSIESTLFYTWVCIHRSRWSRQRQSSWLDTTSCLQGRMLQSLWWAILGMISRMHWFSTKQVMSIPLCFRSLTKHQASLDRGYGRCQVLRKNATLIRKYPNGTWVASHWIATGLDSEGAASSFDRLADAPIDENGVVQKRYDIIQSDGLAGVGERIDPGDIYVNKQSPTNASDNSFTGQAASVPYKNTPMSYKSPVAGHIDKVMITDTENEQTLIKILIRQTRRPELGDKFSSRHGQKGVCGLIVNQEDMPFNDQGISPGILV